MGVLTEVRRLRNFDSSMVIHGFVGNTSDLMLTGDKLVDPYMYPGLCVDYCNGKGTSVCQ